MGSLPKTGHAQGLIRYLGEDVNGIEVERRVARSTCLVLEKRELFVLMTDEGNLLLVPIDASVPETPLPGSDRAGFQLVLPAQGAAQASRGHAVRRGSDKCWQ